MNDKEQAVFRNRTLGFIFQSFHLISSLNVMDNVELPLLYRKMNGKERKERVKEVLEKVGFEPPDAAFSFAVVGRTMSACGHRPGHCGQSGDYSG